MNGARWVVVWNEKPIAWFISRGDAGDFVRAVVRITGNYEVRRV